MKIFRILILLVGIITILPACNNEAMDDNKVLTVTNDSNSGTVETFKELGLGTLLDFEYKWEQADKTWVHIWAEGYQGGKKVEPNLAALIYGFHPSEDVEEGNLSLGFVETSEGPFITLSTDSASNTPQKLNLELLEENIGAGGWNSAIHEKTSAALDETIILAVYRETTGNVLKSGYNYQDKEEIQRMINKYDNLIFFKMKVVEDIE